MPSVKIIMSVFLVMFIILTFVFFSIFSKSKKKIEAGEDFDLEFNEPKKETTYTDSFDDQMKKEMDDFNRQMEKEQEEIKKEL